MELQRELSASPDGPEARSQLFGLAEYFIEKKQPEAAAKYLRRLHPDPAKSVMEILAGVYLMRCEAVLGKPEDERRWKDVLQEALSSRSFFAVFKGSRSQSWRSPMDHVYELTEEVDRLEIKRDGKELYTLEVV